MEYPTHQQNNWSQKKMSLVLPRTSFSSTKIPVIITALSLEKAIPSTVSFPPFGIHVIPPPFHSSIHVGGGMIIHVKPLSSCPSQRSQWSGPATWMVGSADEPRAVSEPM